MYSYHGVLLFTSLHTSVQGLSQSAIPQALVSTLCTYFELFDSTLPLSESKVEIGRQC